jgi:hypothetical protein
LDTSDSRSAASSTFQVFKDEEILGTLHIVAIKSDHELEGASAKHRGGHRHTIDHVVGELHESILHVVSKSEVARGEVNRGGGESLVDLRLEGKSKGVRRRERREGFHTESLNLVEKSVGEVQSLIHDIVGLGAHSSRAIHIGVVRVAEATSSLLHVPLVESEVVLGSLVNRAIIVTPHRAKGEVFEVFASAVTRAVIGAGGSLAAFASVTFEAFAFTSRSIADTSSRAFSILVDVTINIWVVNPSNFIRAYSVGTITGILVSHSPVIITVANIIEAASAVTRAMVVASGMGIANHSSKGYASN